METKIIKNGVAYLPNKDYYVVGARSAWDNVPVGLYESEEEAQNDFPQSPISIIRKATKQEIQNFFKIRLTDEGLNTRNRQ